MLAAHYSTITPRGSSWVTGEHAQRRRARRQM